MNIFASGMISIDFILDRLLEVKSNPKIVQLEIEDLIVRENDGTNACTLLPTVEDLLLAGDREWKSVTFLDCILADQFEWWQGLNRDIMSKFQDRLWELSAMTDATCGGNPASETSLNGEAFTFQANVDVPVGTPLKSLYTLLRAIKLHRNVCSVEFEGALFGCNQHNLIQALWDSVSEEKASDDESVDGCGRDVVKLSRSIAIKVACGWRSSPDWSNLLDICLRGVLELNEMPKRKKDGLGVAAHVSMFSMGAQQPQMRRVRSASGSLANMGAITTGIQTPGGFVSLDKSQYDPMHGTPERQRLPPKPTTMSGSKNLRDPVQLFSSGVNRRRMRRSKSFDMTTVREETAHSSPEETQIIGLTPLSISTAPVHLFSAGERKRPMRRAKSMDMTKMQERRSSPTSVMELDLLDVSSKQQPMLLPPTHVVSKASRLRQSKSAVSSVATKDETRARLRDLEKSPQEMRSPVPGPASDIESSGPPSRKISRSNSASIPRHSISMQADYDWAQTETIKDGQMNENGPCFDWKSSRETGKPDLADIPPFDWKRGTLPLPCGSRSARLPSRSRDDDTESPAFNWVDLLDVSSKQQPTLLPPTHVVSKASRLRRSKSAVSSVAMPSQSHDDDTESPAFNWVALKDASSKKSLPAITRTSNKKPKGRPTIAGSVVKCRRKVTRRSKSMQTPYSWKAVSSLDDASSFDWSSYKGQPSESQKNADKLGRRTNSMQNMSTWRAMSNTDDASSFFDWSSYKGLSSESHQNDNQFREHCPKADLASKPPRDSGDLQILH